MPLVDKHLDYKFGFSLLCMPARPLQMFMFIDRLAQVGEGFGEGFKLLLRNPVPAHHSKRRVARWHAFLEGLLRIRYIRPQIEK